MKIRREVVLLVEDDRDQSIPFRQLLEHAGFQVEPAFNGPDALVMASRVDPDLVIVDLALVDSGGDMDGYEVIRLLRQEQGTRLTPILVWTGGGLRGQDEIRALRLGADDVVAKSAEYGVLEARIQALLRRSRVPRSSARRGRSS